MSDLNEIFYPILLVTGIIFCCCLVYCCGRWSVNGGPQPQFVLVNAPSSAPVSGTRSSKGYEPVPTYEA